MNFLLRNLVLSIVLAIAIGVDILIGAYVYIYPGLPSVERIKDERQQTPMRIFTRDGRLLSIFGEKRRSPVSLNNVPIKMQQALLAAEDDRFFDHPGVDYQGLARATLSLLKTGKIRQGGSTITMQLARNYYLSREKKFVRKLREIFLAFRIEKILKKEEILELYLNKIYLGNRAYGVGAASEIYYGAALHDLTLAQVSMIAGLPKAPSRYNPIINPERAIERRHYVLDRMLALGYITQESYNEADLAPVTAVLHQPVIELHADYVAEMVRAEMFERYGQNAYLDGYDVFTTLRSDFQKKANQALRKALVEYDMRHGYRGPERNIPNMKSMGMDDYKKILKDVPTIADLKPAVVIDISEQDALVYRNHNKLAVIKLDNIVWARKYINENAKGPKIKSVKDVLKIGDIIRISGTDKKGWKLRQIPVVSGALVSIAAEDGSIQALVGGMDFQLSKFNRAVQAFRQPGSSFKPFIYSAALEKGYTPASIINDAPMVFTDESVEGIWRPQNYSGKFFGPTRLREALTLSRNMVSIRLLNRIGLDYAMDYIERFGFKRERLPFNLTLALGSGEVSPIEMAQAYAAFANGGYKIKPFLIERIQFKHGGIEYVSNPEVACDITCESLEEGDLPLSDIGFTDELIDLSKLTRSVKQAPRVLEKRNVFQMVSMMRDVIQNGTGRKAKKIGRKDLAGKTGTTNDQRDAWFSGYNNNIVTTAWVGFDDHTPLGNREVGGVAALPMWIDFMRLALKGDPEFITEPPEGIVTVNIDPKDGLLSAVNNEDVLIETFREEYVPRKFSSTDPTTLKKETPAIPEQLF